MILGRRYREMFKPGDVVIIKGYCGILESLDLYMGDYETKYDITLRDRNDPRIVIEMEDITHDEIFKNTGP